MSASVAVYRDSCGNVVLVLCSDGRPLFGRVLGPSEQRGALSDARRLLEPSSWGVMGEGAARDFSAAHGPIGCVRGGEVFAYGGHEGDPYLRA